MHLIISKDKEELRRALNALLRDLKTPLTSFSPDHFSINAFLQEVETPPFLSTSKSVVIHEINQLSEESLAAIRRYLDRPSAWISLYLTATDLAPQNALFKLMEKQGKVTRFKEEKGWDKEKRLAEWLIQEAKREHVQISLQTATQIVQRVEHATLKSELDKLICFVGERRTITVEDVALLCTPAHHETLWQLGDALFARQVSRALEIGVCLLAEGMVLLPLLAHLRSQFTTGIDILQAAEKNEVAKKFPYLKGGLLEKKLQLLKKYGQDHLEKGILLVYETEIQAKNSSVDPTLLLELLIVKLI